MCFKGSRFFFFFITIKQQPNGVQTSSEQDGSPMVSFRVSSHARSSVRHGSSRSRFAAVGCRRLWTQGRADVRSRNDQATRREHLSNGADLVRSTCGRVESTCIGCYFTALLSN